MPLTFFGKVAEGLKAPACYAGSYYKNAGSNPVFSVCFLQPLYF